MAAWARKNPTSFSSLPTSSSSPSSSASLPPPPFPLLDLADELWFYGSVLFPFPSPSLSLPCLPVFSSSTDSSTLIAQCMFDGDYSSFPLAPSLSPRPRPDSQPTGCPPTWYLHPAPPPAEDADLIETGYPAYHANAYHGYSSLTDSDEDESFRHGYPRPHAGDDEEAFHYYTAHSDWDDEDAYNGYNVPSDCEEEQPSPVQEEEWAAHEVYLEPEDAMSGIYDVAAFLKGQISEETEEVKTNHFTIPPSQILQEAASQVSAVIHFQVSSGKDQADMKESLKLWAHAVASTLPWKAAAQARPLL